MPIFKFKKIFPGLLLFIASSAVFAQAQSDLAVFSQPANYYTCTGKNGSLTFYDHSYQKQTSLLELKLGNQKYAFQGQNIQVQNTVMGRLFTVTVDIVPDVALKKVSFIIPTVRIGGMVFGDQNPTPFNSELIITTIKTPFWFGPILGVTNASGFMGLTCNASMTPLILIAD